MSNVKTALAYVILVAMDTLEPLKEGTYIIAVSGGVDSVALLDILAKKATYHLPPTNYQLIVAHFDHGMRPDSRSDERFVAGLAEKYGLSYETERVELGSNASEETARRARYDFLFRMKAKHGAKSIITAHHADDVVETMVINLLRGSGWRGLCSLRSDQKIVRPLLLAPKKDIIAYARQQELVWREDSTNQDTAYLRNDVRYNVMPHVDRKAWLELYEAQLALQGEIETELTKHRSQRRHDFIMWPIPVAMEVLRAQLPLTRPQTRRVLLAIKTAGIGTRLSIGGRELAFTREEFVIK